MSKQNHIYDCPNCGKEVDATDLKNQIPKKISYQCPYCQEITPKNKALRLMEKKDGRKRYSIINCLEDNINPFTGKKLQEKKLDNGWTELVENE